jgi:hypothetical protein
MAPPLTISFAVVCSPARVNSPLPDLRSKQREGEEEGMCRAVGKEQCLPPSPLPPVCALQNGRQHHVGRESVRVWCARERKRKGDQRTLNSLQRHVHSAWVPDSKADAHTISEPHGDQCGTLRFKETCRSKPGCRAGRRGRAEGAGQDGVQHMLPGHASPVCIRKRGTRRRLLPRPWFQPHLPLRFDSNCVID